MNNHKAITATLVAGVLSLAATGADEAHAKGKEKCYGVVKAAHNDCANAAGTHSCAAQGVADGDGGEWVTVPKGLCEKLVGGSLTPYQGQTTTTRKDG